jgi:hypothetical protein
MTDHEMHDRSDNSADVDFATIQENVTGYFRSGVDEFTRAVKNHPRIAIAAGVTVLASVVAASAFPVLRALKERDLITA